MAEENQAEIDRERLSSQKRCKKRRENRNKKDPL
jgi:hypothetical protein